MKQGTNEGTFEGTFVLFFSYFPIQLISSTKVYFLRARGGARFQVEGTVFRANFHPRCDIVDLLVGMHGVASDLE